jgi:hypothetical protein
VWGVPGAAIGYVVAHAVLASSLAWHAWPVLGGARTEQRVAQTADA